MYDSDIDRLIMSSIALGCYCCKPHDSLSCNQVSVEGHASSEMCDDQIHKARIILISSNVLHEIITSMAYADDEEIDLKAANWCLDAT